MLEEDFEALKREATALIVRITSGEATAEDATALLRWRARSERHERAFQHSGRVWKNLGHALGSERQRSLIPRRSFLAAGSMAAGAAGVALGLSTLGFLPPIDALLSDYATGIGEQLTVELPDGSTMTLDGGTTLSLDYSPGTRHLLLKSGAAVFDVVRDETRPFVVSAAGGDTTAVGASFSVKHGVDDISVDCLQGHITVQCLANAELGEGEAIRYSSVGLGEKTLMDADEAAAWRRGLLIFRDRPLAEVVADLNRHRKGKVVIAGSELRSRHISGVFHLDRPEEVMAQLEDTLQVRPIKLVGGIVLLQ
jgi:transmembrane sensor